MSDVTRNPPTSMHQLFRIVCNLCSAAAAACCCGGFHNKWDTLYFTWREDVLCKHLLISVLIHCDSDTQFRKSQLHNFPFLIIFVTVTMDTGFDVKALAYGEGPSAHECCLHNLQ
jgi:hypothetical protein